MIKLVNVNKYFNRHKKNQIHVINNVNLTFDKTGLVALLGASGSGKTTLLNTIGGLDKVNKGKIFIDGKRINTKISYKCDKIRNLNIGYIFQDYKLVEDATVYDNIKIVLNMLNIKSKKEIDERICYVLDKVGMLRYKNRPVSMLSGGERQRVGIARAIVKNPSIILADEPTGNLDSKNSLEVMKIIKAISKERLVILVTHEVNLAKFYASRIIEIVDGEIKKDYFNNNSDDLDYSLDNNIYLKDFEYKEKLNFDNNNISIYKENKDSLNLSLVIKNGNIYIKNNTKATITVIDDDSNIELINDNYKKIKSVDIDKYDFDFDKIKFNKKIKYTSIFNIVTLITSGFKRVFNYSILKKFLLLGFLFSGAFIMYSVSTISASMRVRDKDFVSINKNYLIATIKKLNVEDYLSYENITDVDYILPGNSIVNFRVKYNDYYQSFDHLDFLRCSLVDSNKINEEDIVYGRHIKKDNEVIIDKLALERMFDETHYAKMIGINDFNDMLNRKISLDNMDDFIIVGIVDIGSPSIYVKKDNFINILYNSNDEYEKEIQDYSLLFDKIELKEGRMPENDYETIVNISNKDMFPINKTINYKINDNKLTVVGYYDTKYDYNYYLVNNNSIKYYLINNSSDMVIMPYNEESVISEFKDKKINIRDSYEVSKKEYINERKEFVNGSIVVSIVILIISLIEIFLMIRSSFMSRVKSVGIYRAIGVKKIDIYKMFFGEIFSITTVSSVPGIILSAYILRILASIKLLSSIFEVNIFLVLVSIIFVYLFNILVGLIPVFNTIRRKPAEILSRYDID